MSRGGDLEFDRDKVCPEIENLLAKKPRSIRRLNPISAHIVICPPIRAARRSRRRRHNTLDRSEATGGQERRNR